MCGLKGPVKSVYLKSQKKNILCARMTDSECKSMSISCSSTVASVGSQTLLPNRTKCPSFLYSFDRYITWMRSPSSRNAFRGRLVSERSDQLRILTWDMDFYESLTFFFIYWWWRSLDTCIFKISVSLSLLLGCPNRFHFFLPEWRSAVYTDGGDHWLKWQLAKIDEGLGWKAGTHPICNGRD